jgi:lipoprotein NlpI
MLALGACKPSEERLYYQAVALSEKGKYKEAITLFSRVIEQNSKNERAYFERAISWYYLDSNQLALKHLNHLLDSKPMIGLEMNPAFAAGDEIWKVPAIHIYYQRALIKYEMDSLKSSFDEFMLCAENGFEKARANFYMGNILKAFGKNEKACSYFKLSSALGDEEATRYLEKECK